MKRKMILETTSLFLLKWVLYLYFVLFFLVYPFYYENKYYNMGDAKWNFFRNMTYYIQIGSKFYLPSLLGLAVLCFLWYCLHLFRNGELKSHLHGGFTVLDRFVMAYAVLISFSTVISPYKNVVIFGYKGWYMGYIAQLSFVLLYFFYSRFHESMKTVYVLTLIVAAVIMFIAVLNRFSFDPLGMFDGNMPHKASEGALGGFLSTLGQTTWYGSYVGLMLPFGMYPFWHSEKWYQRVPSAVFTFIAGMTICTTRADSLYMGLVAVLAVYLYISLGGAQNTGVLLMMRRFWEMVLILLFSFRFIGFLQDRFWERAVILDKIPIFLSHSKWMYLPMALSLLFWGICIFLAKSKNAGSLQKEKKVASILRRTVFLTCLLIVIGIIGFIMYNSSSLITDEQRNPSNYLLFNNWWGHYRGISWRWTYRTFKASLHTNPVQFFFGTGPDAFYKAVYVPNQEAFAKFFKNAVLTNGHNEWMTIFINAGLFGGIAYWGIFISAILTFLKQSRHLKMLVPVAAAVASYVAYNTFCYQQIICTPCIFIIMGVGMWYEKRSQLTLT